MQYYRPLSILTAVIAFVLLTFGFAGSTRAGGAVEYFVTIHSVSCTQLDFSYVLDSESSDGADFAQWVVEVDGVQATNGLGNPYIDSFTVPLNLDSGIHSITVIVQIPGYALGFASGQANCNDGGGTTSEINFGRVCFGPGAVPATLFYYPDRIEVYAIDGNDNGELVMHFTQDYLDTLPARPGGPAFLISDSDRLIPIEFWRNSNGLYRIVAGPDAENKYFECTFGGACSAERSWIDAANAPTDEVVPVCAAPAAPTPAPTAGPTQIPPSR